MAAAHHRMCRRKQPTVRVSMSPAGCLIEICGCKVGGDAGCHDPLSAGHPYWGNSARKGVGERYNSFTGWVDVRNSSANLQESLNIRDRLFRFSISRDGIAFRTERACVTGISRLVYHFRVFCLSSLFFFCSSTLCLFGQSVKLISSGSPTPK